MLRVYTFAQLIIEVLGQYVYTKTNVHTHNCFLQEYESRNAWSQKRKVANLVKRFSHNNVHMHMYFEAILEYVIHGHLVPTRH